MNYKKYKLPNLKSLKSDFFILKQDRFHNFKIDIVTLNTKLKLWIQNYI